MHTRLRFLLLAILAADILAGCGGGSASAANPAPAPTAVAGVATPKAVSVVTAN